MSSIKNTIPSTAAQFVGAIAVVLVVGISTYAIGTSQESVLNKQHREVSRQRFNEHDDRINVLENHVTAVQSHQKDQNRRMSNMEDNVKWLVRKEGGDPK